MPSQNPRLSPVVVTLILHTVQLTGAIMIIVGLCFAFDVGGFARVLNLTDNHQNELIGVAVGFVGLMDLVVVPRILNARFNPKI